MEAKINIVEILKNKPEGISLYSSVFGACVYRGNCDNCIEVVTNNCYYFNEKGHYITNGVKSENGECLLFPSNEMRDWSKFAWKRGDILVSNDGKSHVIFNKWDSDNYDSFYGKHYLNNENKNPLYYKAFICTTEMYSLENKDVSKTYIDAVEEKLVGKLNRETLEIEKQPEFKDGDILYAEKDESHTDAIFILKTVKEKIGHYACLILHPYMVCKYSCGSIGNKTFRYATKEEKLQLFDALAKEGKAWDAEKKQIVDLKPKWMTLKPFDKVITRVDDDAIWTANIFSHIDQYGEYNTIGCVGGYPYCLPYNEETAKLIGTTKEWKE